MFFYQPGAILQPELLLLKLALLPSFQVEGLIILILNEW